MPQGSHGEAASSWFAGYTVRGWPGHEESAEFTEMDTRKAEIMKRTIDSTKRNRRKAWTESANGPSVWLLPGGGQFYTRSCVRCARLLPKTSRHDRIENRERREETLCVHCRDPIDSTILSNETRVGRSVVY